MHLLWQWNSTLWLRAAVAYIVRCEDLGRPTPFCSPFWFVTEQGLQSKRESQLVIFVPEQRQAFLVTDFAIIMEQSAGVCEIQRLSCHSRNSSQSGTHIEVRLRWETYQCKCDACSTIALGPTLFSRIGQVKIEPGNLTECQLAHESEDGFQIRVEEAISAVQKWNWG